MEVIFVVLPLALLLGAVSLWACVRAIRAGQFDDLDTPALRILIEEDEVLPGVGLPESGARPSDPPRPADAVLRA